MSAFGGQSTQLMSAFGGKPDISGHRFLCKTTLPPALYATDGVVHSRASLR
jgi:hypothetical protein